MVKIEKVECFERVIQLKKPFKIALGTITESECIFIRVVTDVGVFGLGQASPETFVTGETLVGCKQAIDLLTEVLIGENPLHIAKIHEKMDRRILGNGAAKAAFDMACYDIMGKIANLPLYQLIGGYRDQVETDITVSIDTPDVMAALAKEHVEQGFRSIKIKVGVHPEEDVARVRAIREAVGENIQLRVDANQGWLPKEALKVISTIETYNIAFIEQPVKAKNIDGLKFVREHTYQKIMADESSFLPEDALSLVKKDCVDFVNIKLMKCGGIYKALKIIAVCESAGVPCMVGCMSGETNVSVAAAAHLVAAQPNVHFADLDATFELQEMPYTGIVGLQQNPIIDLSKSGVGLGVEEK